MRKIIFTTIVIVTVTMLWWGCPGKEPSEGSIVGFVFDESEQKLQGVEITLIDPANKKERKTTDLDGKYEFPNLIWGQSYTIVAELKGYLSDTTPAATVDKMVVRCDFVLKEATLRLSETSIAVNANGEADFVIYNNSQRDMTWTINKSVDWLTLSKTSDTMQAKGAEPIHITITQAPPKTYNITIIVYSPSHEQHAELIVNLTSVHSNGEGATVTPVPYTTLGDIGVQKEDIAGTKTYEEAAALCQQDGWRLPTQQELVTMYAARNEIENLDASGYYWSSTPKIEEYQCLSLPACPTCRAGATISKILCKRVLGYYYLDMTNKGNVDKVGAKGSVFNVRCVRDLP